ncbi:MAG: allophanate hydrolase subunit 2 family protein, partial [Candidatus Accumulibacter sp.]|nr:allophanate hydrolase subunit 2 family protein [Accumulibacter sp.]
MPGLIEVVDGGIGNTIQDSGRFGFRHIGLSVSGCLDAYLARCANALAGNSVDSENPACIEIRAVGPRLLVREGPVRLAFAGSLSATLTRAGEDGEGEVEVSAWKSFTLHPGDEIAFGYLPGGCAYLAVEGGIDSPVQLGSRSTYQRAGIGGVDGAPLATGNLLPCARASVAAVSSGAFETAASAVWEYDDAPFRVVVGPQDALFKAESLDRFLSCDYRVTPQIDRMGIRLEGPEIVHATPENADIVSDCVTPGAIQIPGNGQPIVL